MALLFSQYHLVLFFEITDVVIADPNVFLWIAGYVADAAVINTNGIKTLLANGLSLFPIKDNPFFSNGPESWAKNHPDFPILYNRVFDKFILAEELFATTLQSFETCSWVNYNLCGKLFTSLESLTTIEEIFKVSSVPFLKPDFYL